MNTLSTVKIIFKRVSHQRNWNNSNRNYQNNTWSEITNWDKNMLLKFKIGMKDMNSRLVTTENHISEPENKLKTFSQN